MAIGVVSDEDFENEIMRLRGNIPGVKIENIKRGRGDQKEVPESVRTIIGTDAIENGNDSAKDLARSLGGISDSSVSAYKNGATSTDSYNSPDPVLKNKTNEARLRISNRARTKLLLAIKHITEEKMADAKIKDLAVVANAMSAVIKNIEPDKNAPSQTNFVFYAPRFRQEDTYDTIDVKE